MASLYPFIAEDAHPGQKVDLKIRKFIWKSVGRGDVLALSDYEVNIAGRLSIIVYSGDLNIHLQLLDMDDIAIQGPCVLRINSHTDEQAKYRVEKGELAVSADFGGKTAGIRLARDYDGKMTRCDLTGFFAVSAYLEGVK